MFNKHITPRTVVITSLLVRDKPLEAHASVKQSINRHRFRYRLGAELTTDQYLNQWWPSLMALMCVARPLWDNFIMINMDVCHGFYKLYMNAILALSKLSAKWSLIHLAPVTISALLRQVRHLLQGFDNQSLNYTMKCWMLFSSDLNCMWKLAMDCNL